MKYIVLGQAIAQARKAAGLSAQGDLAKELSVQQQTVSRWEAGSHRPRAEQLPALAQCLRLNLADLRRMAGYDAPAPLAFTQPLPVDRLDAVSFEIFTAQLVEALYGGTVHRQGASGHTQAGLDVEARLPDGRVLGLQCKRVQQFGPSQVAAAVATATARADEMILVLSRTASPQARAALPQDGRWRLWDKDDLSRTVRSELSPDAQDRLIDTFFRGQRLALLGRAEPSPWLTLEEAFRPHVGKDKALSHSWSLFGRRPDLDHLVAAVGDGRPVTLVIGAGGIGKSRLLLEGLSRIAKAEPAVLIRVLSSTETWSAGAQEALGPGPKILVVDDAHDREALSGLFAFAADPTRQARLVVATRPYAADRIRREAAIYSFPDPREVVLQPLGRADLRRLAEEVLAHFGGEPEWAVDIAQLSGDSPLVTAMAARAIAIDRVPFEQAKQSRTMREIILQRFEKVMIGDLGSRSDQAAIQEVLHVLALVQPFHPEDRTLPGLVEKTGGLKPSVAERALRQIVRGGLTVERGGQHRLMPDVLGDYLIDTSVGGTDHLSSMAEVVLSEAPPALRTNAVVNLGRLDWRQTDGDTSQSRLLAAVWDNLSDIDEEYDDRLATIRGVAIFQPRQTIEAVRKLIGRGKTFSALSDILRHVAFSGRYFPEVAELLWGLGKNDARNQGSHPSHPIRTLTEIAELQPGKTLMFAEQLFDFAEGLTARPGAWDGANTPFDLLKPLMATEGHSTRSNRRSVEFRPFFVDPDTLRPLRRKVIDLTLKLLQSDDLKIARRAAIFVNDLISGPRGLFNASPDDLLTETYDEEFAATLAEIGAMLTSDMAPAVAIALARSVNWESRHGSPSVRAAAEAIHAALPVDLAFRTATALSDGWGQVFVPGSDDPLDERDFAEAWIEGLAMEITEAHPDPAARVRFIADQMDQLTRAGESLESAYILVNALVNQDVAFAQAMLDAGLADPKGRIADFAATALHNLRTAKPALAHERIEALLATEDWRLADAVARALSGLRQHPTAQEAALFKRLLAHEDLRVVRAALGALQSARAEDKGPYIDILQAVDLSRDWELIELFATTLCGVRRGLAASLTPTQIEAILGRLLPAPDLDGFWTERLLAEFSERAPQETAAFILARVEQAATSDDSVVRPLPHVHGDQNALRFSKTDQAAKIMQQVWTWLRDRSAQPYLVRYWGARAFQAMFGLQGQALIDFLSPLLTTAQAPDLKIMAAIMGEAEHDLVFADPTFIEAFLGRCQVVAPDFWESATSALYGSAVSGMRGGTPGEPMPRDLADKAAAEAALAKLSAVSPARELYRWIMEHAERAIARSTLEGQMIAQEDES